MATKIFSGGNRVLQKRATNNGITFNEADIAFTFAINSTNRATTGDLIINFNTPLDYIIANFNIGDNKNIFKKVTSTSTISKSTKINDDNNGAGNGSNYEEFFNNAIYIPQNQINNIQKLTISSGVGGGINGINLTLAKVFPNLLFLENKIPQVPNFSFLESIPSILSLDFATSVASLQNLLSLKNSNIEYFVFRGYYALANINTLEFTKNLPVNLYYLQVTQATAYNLKLEEFFTGNRFGLSLSTAQAVASVEYNGGAIFPSAITPKHTAIDYILYTANIPTKLTPTSSARFLVDFANQVASCTLPAAQKRIRMTGVSPDTAYTDASQPLFTTYSAALTHITSTLGITVTFT